MKTFRGKAWVEKFPDLAEKLGARTWEEERRGWWFEHTGGATQMVDPAVAAHIARQKGPCARCGDPGADDV